jgi:hypothetical protein
MIVSAEKIARTKHAENKLNLHGLDGAASEQNKL